MHEQGISYGDIKDNNIMFRTQDFRNSLHSQLSTPRLHTQLQVERDQKHITKTCEDAKD